MTMATITTKGQITIPKSVRDSLKLHSGDKIEFIVTDKMEAVMRPISKKVDEVFGRLNRPGMKAVSVEELNQAIKKRMKDRYK